MLVIPCGHTVCKSCVRRRNDCPTCRCDVVALTYNIMLQQIILDYQFTTAADAREKKECESKRRQQNVGRRRCESHTHARKHARWLHERTHGNGNGNNVVLSLALYIAPPVLRSVQCALHSNTYMFYITAKHGRYLLYTNYVYYNYSMVGLYTHTHHACTHTVHTHARP